MEQRRQDMSKREEGEMNITQRGCKLNSIPTETFNLKRAAERGPDHTRAAMAITGDIPTVLGRTWGDHSGAIDFVFLALAHLGGEY